MTLIDRLMAGIGFIREQEAAPERPMFIAPPPRGGAGWTSDDRALSLSTVYRAVQIHATAAIQLGIDVERGSSRLDTVPSIIAEPDPLQLREEWIEYLITSMWLTGDAFWRRLRNDRGVVVSLEPLNPHEVGVTRDPRTRRPVYTWLNEPIATSDMRHLKMLTIPGRLRGLGPIQAARLEVEGAISARDYGASWLDESAMPSGILTSDQELTPDMASQYKTLWKEQANGHEVRVLGSGLSFEPLMLKPADLQFLETQQYNTTAIARLMGVPASLMLAVVEGKAMTYSNVIDEWRGYLQFTAMKPLRAIEAGLSAELPRGQRARFNLDAFLRLDTKSRYEAYEIGIRSKLLDVEEARATEGLPPRATPALTQEDTDAAV